MTQLNLKKSLKEKAEYKRLEEAYRIIEVLKAEQIKLNKELYDFKKKMIGEITIMKNKINQVVRKS